LLPDPDDLDIESEFTDDILFNKFKLTKYEIKEIEKLKRGTEISIKNTVKYTRKANKSTHTNSPSEANKSPTKSTGEPKPCKKVCILPQVCNTASGRCHTPKSKKTKGGARRTRKLRKSL
jgi:hypothetical protein